MDQYLQFLCPLYKVHLDMTVIEEDLLNTYIDEISVGLSQIFKDTSASLL